MTHSIHFDKLFKCKGCVSEGAEEKFGPLPCKMCERNPSLLKEISDNYEKVPLAPKLPAINTDNLPDDSNPAAEANKKELGGWGVELG